MTRGGKVATVLVAAVLACSGVAWGQATRPGQTPAAAIENIRNIFQSARRLGPEQGKARLKEVFAALAEMESAHPDAPEIHEARVVGLVSAVMLAFADKDQAMVARAETIGKTLLASQAPARWKVLADSHLLALKLEPPSGPTTVPAAERPALIRQFVQRYAKTDQAVEALTNGAQLAAAAEDHDLGYELEQTLIREHPDSAAAKELTRWQGKPFEAALTKLDGTRLSLPKDLLGKVVVVDFWAVWCGPCVAEIPRMREIYAKYKSQGVEFVGISLDKDKQRLGEFVAKQQMNWVHTFSGQEWKDPTARRYGVEGIPSIWVVGKDGKVFTSEARGRLAWAIEKALKPPTTRPAGGATTAPAP